MSDIESNKDKIRGLPIPDICKELNNYPPLYDDDVIMKAVNKYLKKQNMILNTTRRNKKGYFWNTLQSEETS